MVCGLDFVARSWTVCMRGSVVEIGTFLVCASARGHALIDRELYLPESRTADCVRCRAAGVPDEVEFATKPRQAMAMLERAFTAGIRFGWITADEAYGQVKYLRVWLEEHGAAHVLCTKRNDTLITTTGGEARADASGRRASRAGMAAIVGRRGVRATRVRLGSGGDPHLLAARTQTLVAGTALDHRPDCPQPRPSPTQRIRASDIGRSAVEDEAQRSRQQGRPSS
jgi:hypothetical protein